MKKLTIAIPTYNRNETLNESIAFLLPQLSEECHLLILDDNSPTPVAGTVDELLKKCPAISSEVRRNKCNLGLVGNVLRCFEYCETEWIWVPGDDDIILPDTIAKIIAAAKMHPDAAYFSFLTEPLKNLGVRKGTIVAKGIDEFVEVLDMVGVVNFMSCSVWKTDSFRRFLSSGYGYAYSTGWTLALLLSGLGTEGKAVFSEEAIVKAATIAPPSTRWSYRKFIFGWATLLEIPSSAPVRNKLAKKMLRMHSPENVTAYLLADAATRAWPDRFLYYDLAVGRLRPYHVHRLSFLRFALYRLLFISPRFGWKLVRFAIRTANRLGIKSVDVADLEGRGDT
jgi:glycosyltransferase involved in cell wall biosynthesis